MHNVRAQIVAAIKKIRTHKGRPDDDKIFKEVFQESATNITLQNNQQALRQMVSKGKVTNILNKGLDSYYVVDAKSVEITCCQNIDFQKSPYSNDNDSFSSLTSLWKPKSWQHKT